MVLNNLYFCIPYKNSEETYSQMTDSIQYMNFNLIWKQKIKQIKTLRKS